MSVTDEIRDSLAKAFSPESLDVRDDSERHRGHAGYKEGGESHFHVTIRATALDGMTRVARHRALHDALGPELIARIHALSFKVLE